jgi:hypothetical protein
MSLAPYRADSEVNPSNVFTLRKFGLITEEQAEAAYAEWDEACADWDWRYLMSGLAWKNLPLRKRLFFHPLKWRFAWIDASRKPR